MLNFEVLVKFAMFMSVDIFITLLSGSNIIGTCMAVIIYTAAVKAPLVGKGGLFSKK
ncbi:hypothetical protein KNV09_gp123 [Vibrio phage Athena]|uniref:Uncharacterized protein n=9 Tax=Thalassavirus TaxID=2948922 RepID=A0A6M4ESD9_9CAUD|nr:hypothetical protein KNU52_gp105 [Vibrio phage Achelous]YP_010102596.1 hypothetical protein KNU58_gp109 [Vibrio phage Brizo]YP_010105758.1 hypothetical protein KNU87_gp121 [Vibrio phage Bennett]YP_010105949.1 hypothetical protein KNU88_gp123 [Vibrio phage Chester]YP_010108209.1 hypothetical protein KNV06_gp120 [Vibrio phage AG74]YP_010108400.1 hypothetical protein KNV07_gp122 [Vibrio phage Cody]YP_010108594.1 hypothetical protein KNV08_gp126 [Vibrio phage Quinn]YP_010108787.1 hypothetical